jgi:hypothetical protein
MPARAERSPSPNCSTVRVSFSRGEVICRARGMDPRARKTRMAVETFATWATCAAPKGAAAVP